MNASTYEQYRGMDADSLYELLGSVSQKPSLAIQDHRVLCEDDKLREGDIRALGNRIFLRWAQAAHDFACAPNADDKGLADKLKFALTGQAGGVAMIAGVIVGAFGISPVTAALIAALLVKLIIAPTADEVCKTWAAALAGTKS